MNDDDPLEEHLDEYRAGTFELGAFIVLATALLFGVGLLLAGMHL